MKLPHDPALAASAVLSGFSTATDLGVINGKVFLTVAATGFDAAVARRVHDGGFSLFGAQAYLVAALSMLPRWPAPRLRLRGDFGEREGPYLLAAAGNTSRYGRHPDDTGGVTPRRGAGVLPDPRPVAVPGAALLPQTYSGSRGRYAEVEMLQTRRLEIEAEDQVFMTADGELMGESRAVIEVAPGALLIQGRAQ